MQSWKQALHQQYGDRPPMAGSRGAAVAWVISVQEGTFSGWRWGFAEAACANAQTQPSARGPSRRPARRRYPGRAIPSASAEQTSPIKKGLCPLQREVLAIMLS